MLQLSCTTETTTVPDLLFFNIMQILPEEEIIVICMFKSMTSYSQFISQQHTSVVCIVFLKVLREKTPQAVAALFLCYPPFHPD